MTPVAGRGRLKARRVLADGGSEGRDRDFDLIQFLVVRSCKNMPGARRMRPQNPSPRRAA